MHPIKDTFFFIRLSFTVHPKSLVIFGLKAKIGCVSELKINVFILYFSQLALSLCRINIVIHEYQVCRICYQ